MRTNMMIFSWHLVTSDVGLAWLDIRHSVISYPISAHGDRPTLQSNRAWCILASMCFALNRLEQDVGPTLQCIVGGQTGFLNKLLNSCGMPCNALDMWHFVLGMWNALEMSYCAWHPLVWMLYVWYVTVCDIRFWCVSSQYVGTILFEKRQMGKCDVSSQLNSNSGKVCKVLQLVSTPNIAAWDFCFDWKFGLQGGFLF